MKLITKRKIEQDVEVDLKPPMFWKEDKNSTKYVALLDDKTVVRLNVIDDDYTAITHSTPTVMDDALLDAYINYNLCSESEFMQAYDDAWESIRMRPVEHNNGFDKEVNDNLKQSITY